MKSIAIALTGFLAMASPGGFSAEPEPAMTADDLQQLCGGTDHVSIGFKIADGKISGGRPCVPAAISAESLEQTMKKKLDQDLAASPGDRSLDASAFVGRVLLAAYPCSNSGR